MANEQGFNFGVATARIGLDTTEFDRGTQRLIQNSKQIENATKQIENTYKGIGYSYKSAFDTVFKGFETLANAYQKQAELVDRSNGIGQIQYDLLMRTADAYRQNAIHALDYVEALGKLSAQETALIQNQNKTSGFSLKGPDLQGALGQYANQNSLLKGPSAPSFAPDFGGDLSAAGGLNLQGVLQQLGPAGILGALGPVGLAVGAIGTALNQWSAFINRAVQGIQSLLKPLIQMHDQVLVSSGIFTGFTGSLTASAQVVRVLRDYASAAGLSFQDMLQAAQYLFPAMKRAGDSTKDLTRYLETARRLAVLNPGPRGGIEGASIAISEAIASGGRDVRSLQQRFNLSRDLIKEFIKDANGDVVQGLQAYLDKVGVTSAATDAVANTFDAATQRLGDALTRLGASAISPFLDNTLIPLINQTAKLIKLFADLEDQTHAIGKIFDVATNPVAAAYKTFINPNLGAPNVGNPGGSSTAIDNVVSFLKNVFIGLNNVFTWIEVALGNFAKVVNTVGATIYNILASIVQTVSGALRSAGFGSAAKQLDGLAQSLTQNASILNQHSQQLEKNNENLILMALAAQNAAQGLGDFGAMLNNTGLTKDTIGPNAGLTVSAGLTDSGRKAFNPVPSSVFSHLEDMAKVTDLKDQISSLTSESEASLAQKREEFANQQSQQWLEFLRQRKREDEDYARQKLASEQKLNEDIASADSGLADKRTDITNSRDKDIAKIQEDAQKTESIQLADHLHTMERMRQDSAQRLQDAAAHLDAIAFIKELESSQKQQKQAEDDFQAQQIQRKADVADRIAQAKKEADDKLAIVQREHDQQVTALRTRFAEEQKAAAENFSIQRARQLEDFNIRKQQEQDQFNKEYNIQVAAYQKSLGALQAQLNPLIDASNAGVTALDKFGQAITNLARAALGSAGDLANGGSNSNGGELSSGGGGGSSGGSGGSGTTTPTSKYTGAWSNFDLVWGQAPKDASTAVQNSWFRQPFFGANGVEMNANAIAYFNHYFTNAPVPNYDVGGEVKSRGLYSLMAGERIMPSDINRTVRSMLGENYTHQSLVSALSSKGSISISAPITIGTVNNIKDAKREIAAVVDEVVIKRLEGYLST